MHGTRWDQSPLWRVVTPHGATWMPIERGQAIPVNGDPSKVKAFPYGPAWKVHLDRMGGEFDAVRFDWPQRGWVIRDCVFESPGIFNENAWIPGRFLP